MCSQNLSITCHVHCKAHKICKLKASICNTEPLSKHQGHEFVFISGLNYITMKIALTNRACCTSEKLTTLNYVNIKLFTYDLNAMHEWAYRYSLYCCKRERRTNDYHHKIKVFDHEKLSVGSDSFTSVSSTFIIFLILVLRFIICRARFLSCNFIS